MAQLQVESPGTDSPVDDVPDMTFSSSPIQYPASSSPAPAPVPVSAPKQKRRLFQTLSKDQPEQKRLKLTRDESVLDITQDSSLTHLNVERHSLPVVIEQPESLDEPAQNEERLALSHPPASSLNLGRGLTKRTTNLQTSSGKTLKLASRKKQAAQTYEQIIAERSKTAEGRAKRAYYGVEIHRLIDDAKIQLDLDAAAKERQVQQPDIPQPSIERPQSRNGLDRRQYQMWTEKYRAKRFTELVGDERTHRSVLRWLKAWDSIVFPGSAKARSKKIYEDPDASQGLQHRKIMLLTGPPGLGKTTLAHVCAKQAGYEVLEINASDDRSRDVVRGRIKDALGTETVRGIQEPGKSRKAGRPVCIVVDEVDGVVSGSGGTGGEGGFMRALIDLVQLDQKNAQQPTPGSATVRTKKGDKFRLLRPLILICNDVYAPSLRPLRQSSMAEIVHVRKPPLEKVIARLKTVFERENIPCDNDAVRRLCEDTWGLGSRKNSSASARGSGDGDIRGVLVQGEWMAHKLRLESSSTRLTRKWIETQISSSSKSRTGPRGGTREVLDRIFLEGAGLSDLPTTTLTAEEERLFKESKANPIGVADLRKRAAITALREMIDTTGEQDRLMTDCFAVYGSQAFQDDTFLSKPNASYDWLYFHDSVSSRIFSGQEWELNPYLSTGACAFHHLFANMGQGPSWADAKDKDNGHEEESHPFAGPKADFAAHEAEKANRTVLTELQGNFSAELLRLFSSVGSIASELIPNVSRILSPDVKPVVVGGSGGAAAVASVRKESERNCVGRSVRVMNALGVAFERVRIEAEGYGSGGFALRMEPPIDALATYHLSTTKKTKSTVTQPTRYAVRQVLEQELKKEKILQASIARSARGNGAAIPAAIDEDKENVKPLVPSGPVKVKRDFFGRPIVNVPAAISVPAEELGRIDASSIAKSTATKGKAKAVGDGDEGRVWVSFHEGFSNAVRKPITLGDLMEGF